VRVLTAAPCWTAGGGIAVSCSLARESRSLFTRFLAVGKASRRAGVVGQIGYRWGATAQLHHLQQRCCRESEAKSEDTVTLMSDAAAKQSRYGATSSAKTPDVHDPIASDSRSSQVRLLGCEDGGILHCML
jgi:hypothetical protein